MRERMRSGCGAGRERTWSGFKGGPAQASSGSGIARRLAALRKRNISEESLQLCSIVVPCNTERAPLKCRRGVQRGGCV